MTVRRFPLVVFMPVFAAAMAGAAAAQTVVEGASKKVTVACTSAGVRVAGLSNEVTLTGRCEEVTVEGKSNTVHVAALGRLTLAGSSNRVYWKDGIDGRAPRIDRSGTDNVAERRGSDAPLAEPAPSADAGRSSGSGVRITAERDKATVSTGTVVVDAEKKVSGGGTRSASSASRSSAPAATDALVFSDNREQRSVDCGGRAVEVVGNRNELRLRGTCAAVRVTGNENEIDVDAASIIATPGNENTVRYRDLIDDRPPQVSNTGRDNTIRRAKP